MIKYPTHVRHDLYETGHVYLPHIYLVENRINFIIYNLRTYSIVSSSMYFVHF